MDQKTASLLIKACNLLAFKVVDLINVCDMNGFDIDMPVTSLDIDKNYHLTWVKKFISSFEDLHIYERAAANFRRLDVTVTD